MASVIKIQRKTRAGVDANGKVIWKPAKGVLYYAKVKGLDGKWTQVPTHKTSPAAAGAWAKDNCACDKCGGPERIQRRQEAQAATAQAEKSAKLAGELMDTWIASLSHRSLKQDQARMRMYVRPYFGNMRIADITLPVVLGFVDHLRQFKDPNRKGRGKRLASDGRLSGSTARHNLNMLSRFMNWAVSRGHAAMNPVMLVPRGERPRPAPKDQNRPWIQDDKVVRDIMTALPSPFREMFYISNRSGARNGEVIGLRMSDMDFLDRGVIRVRYSYDGPLKEDKYQEGKSKDVPAPDDHAAVLGPWLARRRAEGAQPEDYVFPYTGTRDALEQKLGKAFRKARAALGLSLTFYEAGRHSMASRNLSKDAPLDEVSAGLNHSSPLVTRRHYDHFQRRTFSATLRAGIGATVPSEDATVLEFPNTRRG